MADVAMGLEFYKVALTFVAAGAGSWLSVRYLPLKAKRDEWFWKKQIESEQIFFDKLSEITFQCKHTVASEYIESFPMTEKSVADVEKDVLNAVRVIHERSGGLMPFMDEDQIRIIDSYLTESQELLDNVRETWGQWYSDDHQAAEDHTFKMLAELGSISEQALHEFKKKYLKNVK